jgi:RNA polymerase sigma-70 factor (ECF subfamily)
VTALGHRAPAQSDSDLLARASDGNESAFRELYERHVGAVRGYLVGRVGPDAVDDIMNETFTTAWRTAARFDATATSARPWLYGIATNVLARHREREARWIERQRLARTPLVAHETTAYDLDPELARAVGALSPALRDVLLLSALGELDPVEVARALQIRPSTARVRLLRARRQLRRSLEGTDHA